MRVGLGPPVAGEWAWGEGEGRRRGGRCSGIFHESERIDLYQLNDGEQRERQDEDRQSERRGSVAPMEQL
jgi:hypothetical protein